MKIIRHIKAGVKVTPALSILLYYLFILLDIYTTYLATPDLKYESNWMVRNFNLGWGQILLKDFIIVIFMTLALLLALNYIHKYFQSCIKSNKNVLILVLHNYKLLLCLIVFGTFYSHLFYSVFITINNYLGYIYIYRIGSVLSKISTFYINKTMLEHPFFHLYIQLLAPIPGFIVAAYKIKKIRDKYRAISA